MSKVVPRAGPVIWRMGASGRVFLFPTLQLDFFRRRCLLVIGWAYQGIRDIEPRADWTTGSRFQCLDFGSCRIHDDDLAESLFLARHSEHGQHSDVCLLTLHLSPQKKRQSQFHDE